MEAKHQQITTARARATASHPGVNDPGDAALAPDTCQTSPDQKPFRTRQGGQHACEGTKRNGKPCGFINTLQTLEGGWRCRHHRDGLTLVYETVPAPPTPPITTLTTKRDAERFLAW